MPMVAGLAIPPGPGGLAVLGDRLKKRKATVQGGTEDRWAHRGTTTAMAKQSSSHLYTTDAAAELGARFAMEPFFGCYFLVH